MDCGWPNCDSVWQYSDYIIKGINPHCENGCEIFRTVYVCQCLYPLRVEKHENYSEYDRDYFDYINDTDALYQHLRKKALRGDQQKIVDAWKAILKQTPFYKINIYFLEYYANMCFGEACIHYKEVSSKGCTCSPFNCPCYSDNWDKESEKSFHSLESSLDSDDLHTWYRCPECDETACVSFQCPTHEKEAIKYKRASTASFCSWPGCEGHKHHVETPDEDNFVTMEESLKHRQCNCLCCVGDDHCNNEECLMQKN